MNHSRRQTVPGQPVKLSRFKDLVGESRRGRTGARNCGQTLLELVAATIIISTAMVPTLRLTRNSLQTLDRVEQAERCHFFCVSTIEESMMLTSANWQMQPRMGDFSSMGWPNYRFQVTISDSPTEGGMPDALAVINTLVWFDENGSGSAEADEVHCRLQTKLAKLQSYENEANVQ